jgi:acetyl-CoA C-acetyltransferase
MAPKWVMMAPEAVQKLCALTKLSLNDFDLIELNEAFAVQSVALARKLELDPEGQRQRRRGGARPPDRLLGRARPDDAAARAAGSQPREGHAAGLCLGGGNAVALSVEMI